MKKGDIERLIPYEKDIDNFNTFIDKFKEDIDNNKDHYIKRIIWGNTKTNEEIKRINDSGKFEEFIKEEFLKYGIDIGFYYGKEQYIGENKLGIEIKNDKIVKNTGNIYIEYQERHTQVDIWTNSGILKEDNSKYWLIGDFDNYYIISKETLVDIFKNKKYDRIVETPTSRGYVLKINKHKEIIIADNIEDFIRRWLGG